MPGGLREKLARLVNALVAAKLQVAAAALGVVLIAALAYGIRLKAEQDMASAMAAYRTESALDAASVASAVESKFEQIYGGLRTIGMLPSVRRIDRHGADLDQDALASIQQLYNNLAASVEISEVYVVPADFNPDRIDPVTGALQAPILMFDELIVDAGARARRSGEEAEGEHADEPEVEIFEYRELVRQMTWLRLHAPTNADFSGLERPMLSSRAVITCDNTIYINTGDDADRMGVILSVPFYDLGGRLAGTVSAIIRTEALAEYLPDRGYLLLNAVQALQVGAAGESEAERSAQWSLRGARDPSAVYSDVLEIRSRDPEGSWRLWVGKPDAEFFGGAAARSVRAFEIWTYVALALVITTIAATLAVLVAGVRSRQQRTRQKLLEDHASTMSLMAEQQAALKVRADQANLHKSQFLANMSHELRTPLNAILGYGEILQEDAADLNQPSMVKDLDRILSAGRHLLSLINSILDLAKVEAGRVEVEAEEFDVDELVAEAAEFVRPTADKKGLSLVVESSGVLGVVRSDALKIKQCLLNLLSNAIKFTEHGTVTLRAARQSLPEGERLVFEVADTGAGLSPDQLSRLFQPFAQADASIARTHGGTGLGLVITRNICQLLGGDISVQSVAKSGSTFTMSVVAAACEDAAAGGLAPVVAGGTRGGRPIVLVIDDEPSARDLMQRALERVGFAVCAAATAEQGLGLAGACAPVLICLDLNLPDRSGWTVLAALVAGKAAPPVMVVSVEDCGAKSMALGACAHLTKPIDRDQFTAAVVRFARSKAESEPAAGVTTAASAGRS